MFHPTIGLAPAHVIGSIDVSAARASSGVQLYLPASVPFRRYEPPDIRRHRHEDYEEEVLMQWPLHIPSDLQCQVIRGNVSVDLIGLLSQNSGDIVVRLKHHDMTSVLLNGTGTGRRLGRTLSDRHNVGMPRQAVTHGALQQPFRARQHLSTRPPVWTFRDLEDASLPPDSRGCAGLVNVAAGKATRSSGILIGGLPSYATDGIISRSYSEGGAALAVLSSAASSGGPASARAGGGGSAPTAWLEVDLGQPLPVSAVRLWSLDVSERQAQPEVQTVSFRADDAISGGSYRLGLQLANGNNVTTGLIDVNAAAMKSDAANRLDALASVQAALESTLRGVLVSVARVSDDPYRGYFSLSITLFGGGNVPQLSVPPQSLQLLRTDGRPAYGARSTTSTQQDGVGNVRLDGTGEAVSVFPRCIGGSAVCGGGASSGAQAVQPAWLLLSKNSIADGPLASVLANTSIAFKRKIMAESPVAETYDTTIAMPKPVIARFIRVQRTDLSPLVVSELQAFTAGDGSASGGSSSRCPTSLAAYTGPAQIAEGSYPSHSSLRVFEGAPVEGPWFLEVVRRRNSLRDLHSLLFGSGSTGTGRSSIYHGRDGSGIAASKLTPLQQRLNKQAPRILSAGDSGGHHHHETVVPVTDLHDVNDHLVAGYLSSWSLRFSCTGSGGANGISNRRIYHADAQICLHSLPSKGSLNISSAVNSAAAHIQSSSGQPAPGDSPMLNTNLQPDQQIASSSTRSGITTGLSDAYNLHDVALLPGDSHCSGAALTNHSGGVCLPDGVRNVATGDGAAAWSGDGAMYSLSSDGSTGITGSGSSYSAVPGRPEEAVLTYASNRHSLIYTPHAGETSGSDVIAYTVALGVPGGAGRAGAANCHAPASTGLNGAALVAAAAGGHDDGGSSGAFPEDVSIVQLNLRPGGPGARVDDAGG